jgi:hypothetical protein
MLRLYAAEAERLSEKFVLYFDRQTLLTNAFTWSFASTRQQRFEKNESRQRETKVPVDARAANCDCL